MPCQFTIPFSMTPAELVEKARQQIGSNGTFDGDTSGGTFRINNPDIRGNYTITGQNLNVTITKKPMLAPCNTIKNKLAEMLES